MKRFLFGVVAVFTALTLLIPATPALAQVGLGAGKAVVGTLTAVDTTATSVTIKPLKGGTNVVLTANAGTFILHNGVAATLADLHVGDRVEARYNPATFIASKIIAHAVLKALVGTLTAVDTTAGSVTITPLKGGTNVVLTANASTFILHNGVAATLADLQVGDRVETRYDLATFIARKIIAHTVQKTLVGTIAAVDTTAGSVTITPVKGGTNVVLTTNTSTAIMHNGAAATLVDLQVGDWVQAKYNPTTLLASQVIARTAAPKQKEVMGTIAAVDTTAGKLTIVPWKGGTNVVLTTNSSTAIMRNGAAATLADLKAGDKIQARYDPISKLASKIEAATVGSRQRVVVGKIAAVDTTAGNVTITSWFGGTNVVLTTNTSTVIMRNGAPATLADLLAGDWVLAKYDPTSMLASKILVGH